MSQAVVKVIDVANELALQTIEGGKRNSFALEFSLPDSRMIMLSSILIILQIMDGLLTTVGVGTFGIMAEGNLILRSIMYKIGVVNCLLICKGLAISIIIFLSLFGKSIKWLPTALSLMIFFYSFAAIVPWVYILGHAYLV